MKLANKIPHLKNENPAEYEELSGPYSKYEFHLFKKAVADARKAGRRLAYSKTKEGYMLFQNKGTWLERAVKQLVHEHPGITRRNLVQATSNTQYVSVSYAYQIVLNLIKNEELTVGDNDQITLSHGSI